MLILVISLAIILDNFEDERKNKERLEASILYDHKYFPSLPKSIFFYQRIHVRGSGS